MSRKPNIGYDFTENQKGLNRELFLYIELMRSFNFIKYWEMNGFEYSPEYVADQYTRILCMQKQTQARLRTHDNVPWYMPRTCLPVV
jgi:hypothetical protein